MQAAGNAEILVFTFDGAQYRLRYVFDSEMTSGAPGITSSAASFTATAGLDFTRSDSGIYKSVFTPVYTRPIPRVCISVDCHF